MRHGKVSTCEMSSMTDVQVYAIQASAACNFDVYYGDMMSGIRTADVALARQIAMYTVRKKLKLSYTKIARYFNKKDHTTVIHAEAKIEAMRSGDNRIAQFLEDWGV